MVVLRCTRKLLDHVGPPIDDPPASTSRLGDWYAKPFPVAQRPFVLLMSGTSRLPVVIPGGDDGNLAANFSDALAAVLWRFGLPAEVVNREVEASRDVLIAAADSTSMLGSLNGLAALAKQKFERQPDTDVVDLSVSLGETPVTAMGFAFPRDIARELLA